ncbi:MAG TPA: alpha/beta hydrolase [Solirubrobacteraceae bacterium]|nr:alpha/beta hydrolase [Solirubrobacteraceae bacterium]
MDGFAGFELTDVETPRGRVHARVGGNGPPLLILHGFPQTHLMWHPVAQQLAEHHTVVAADLPGYGDSFRPTPADDHAPHSKREFARDLVAAMSSLGHERFAVAGHDRGGRVAYRMALDHPGTVTRLAVLDIVPTGELWRRADANFAAGYWHWGFLAQAAPLPERMLLGDPAGVWIAIQRMGIKEGDERYPAAVVDAYREQLTDPATVEAICEDYRAGATIDRALDDEDQGTRTIACPVRVLWGGAGALPRFYDDPLELWRTLAPDATGRAVEGASHFLVEDAPGEVAADLAGFLTAG